MQTRLTKDAGKSADDLVPRAERRTAHLPVTVRRFRYVPFFSVDAQLIDLSEGGAKLQFPPNVSAKPGAKFWVEVPRMMDGAGGKGALYLLAECRWCNGIDATLGVTFEVQGEDELDVLKKLISDLKALGRMPC